MKIHKQKYTRPYVRHGKLKLDELVTECDMKFTDNQEGIRHVTLKDYEVTCAECKKLLNLE